ncbi:pyridoxine 5'-phosphate synthase [Polyangium aurulentum]|uniref:pyridoxine 5'-phosphate synthase n=1 Tax=Polyangium aurulentum TaxID=2567896 RepID=UPI0010AE26E7|nr:pyridoxine 5'-phosphate synthase [Polyangium aurulentum]UQA59672.1 pyridoxine 5'-phosphate synthase [Polyangium aurulentum]
MPVRLHINIDHVATVRNARGTRYPDPVFAAGLCEAAGADGITAHLREDRRHIRDDDVERLRVSIDSLFNLEMAVTEEMLGIAARVKPDVITLVPERREERTTEGGLDVEGQRAGIEAAVKMAKERGIKVSLFIAPDEASVEASAALGVAQVELHTGEYCHAAGARAEEELGRLRRAAARASALGLEVAAGHGLTRRNVGPVVAIPDIVEVNIGHSVIADAVFFGLERAVRDLRRAINRGARNRARS